jgi:hypothetical protein
MFPRGEQIQDAAYVRWERRGRLHGFDREDWLGAERDLVFGLNYAPVARYRLGGPSDVVPADRRPRCRFCEQERAGGWDTTDVIPPDAGLGAGALWTSAECDECHEAIGAATTPELARLVAAVSSVAADPAATASIELTVGALKALARIALLIAPEADLVHYADTAEWIGNPDHEQDRGALAGAFAWVYLPHVPMPGSAVSLVRKMDPDAAFPHLVLLLGTPRWVIQAAVPFGTPDDDRDGEHWPMPRLSLACGEGHDFRDSRCLRAAVALPSRAGRRALGPSA